MTTVPQLAQTLQTVCTTTADAAARSTGFVQRRAQLSGAAFVQALVFGWRATPHASIAALAQAAAVVGVVLSPQGLDQRGGEAAAAFREEVRSAAVPAVIAAEPGAIPLVQRFTAVVLLDCSTVGLPAALGLWWPGCGGSRLQHTQAALKRGVRFDLCSGALRGPLLTDGRTPESTTPIPSAPLPAGALRLADRGFFDLAVLAQSAAQDGYWLARLHFTTAVYEAPGRRCDLLDLLAAPGTAPVDRPMARGAQQHLAARLLAGRVPQEVADQRRHRPRSGPDSPRGPPGLVRLDHPHHQCPPRPAVLARSAGAGPRSKAHCSSSSGRATATSMSRAVARPGACCARSMPRGWPWSSNIGSC
jgi:hypothetical protein